MIFSFENNSSSINFAFKHINMKKTLSLLALICTSLASFSQVIPNGNFETWAGGEPANWTTFNSLASLLMIDAPAVQETPAPEGSSCINISVRNSLLFGIVPGLATTGQMDLLTGSGTSGFPTTARPNFFEGVYKHNEVISTDTAIAYVTLTKWNATTMTQDVIADGGMLSIGGTADWTSFSMPMNYYSDLNPDSCSVIIGAFGSIGNNSSFDNLRLSMTSNVAEQSAKKLDWMVYPNPTTDQLSLSLAALAFSGDTQLEIWNPEGQLVHQEKLTNVLNPSISVAHLTNGRYEVVLRNGNRRMTKTFVKM
jgi:hypothetical protein